MHPFAVAVLHQMQNRVNQFILPTYASPLVYKFTFSHEAVFYLEFNKFAIIEKHCFWSGSFLPYKF